MEEHQETQNMFAENPETAGVEEEANQEPEPKEAEQPEQQEETQKARNKRNNEARLIRQRNEAREEARRIAEELAYERGKREALESLVSKFPRQEDKRPSLDDYDTDEEYQDALIEWKLAQREQKTKEAPKEQPKEDTSQNTKQAQFPPYVVDAIQEMIRDGRNKYDDFDEIISDSTLPISETVGTAVALLDNGADVLHYLSQNVDILENISTMKPRKAASEISKLAKKLDRETNKTSQAPEPIKPVAGKNAGGGGRDPSKMSMDEWMQWRNQQQQRR